MNKIKRRMDTPEARAFWEHLDKAVKGIEIKDWDKFKKDNPWLFKNYSSGDYT